MRHALNSIENRRGDFMDGKIRPSYDENRTVLKDIIPLAAPFTVFIEPTRMCNFKCFYCLHSTPIPSTNSKNAVKHMSEKLYEKILNDLMAFERPIKRIVYSGLGEPLMNKNLSTMISVAKNRNIAERLDVLTNASLLSKSTSNELVDAGISRLQVSLQGLNSKQYRDISNVEIDFEQLYENINYFYQNKKGSTVFVKIIDALLETEDQKSMFYSKFTKCSDQLFIEHLITLQHQMGDHNGLADNTRNLNNERLELRNVCPVIFYMLQVDAEGDVFPCPVSGLPKSFRIGNVFEQSLTDIWNGDARKNLLKIHLENRRMKHPVCGNCYSCATVLDERENLDNDVEYILNKLDK